VPVVARLLAAARRAGITVVHTREGHLPDLSDCHEWKLERSRRAGAAIGSEGPLGRFLVRGEPGHAIVERVAPLPDELVIDKPGKDAFLSTRLADELSDRDISHLLVAGVTTECCVSSTIRTANDLGYTCVLIEDACGSPVPRYHEAAVEIVAEIFGCVTTSDAVVTALSEIRMGTTRPSPAMES
jgi:nicotinamidase-related amidase